MTNLKFRAWDKVNKVMIPAVHIFINGSGVVWVNKRDGIEGSDCLVATTDYDIMQYIDELDKNSLEVCKNDILKQNKSIGICKYKLGKFYIDWVIARDGFNGSIQYHINDCEIIGNIYTNPELLL
jgi:uncharacterized phage protein (TIGR01671 family)